MQYDDTQAHDYGDCERGTRNVWNTAFSIIYNMSTPECKTHFVTSPSHILTVIEFALSNTFTREFTYRQFPIRL